MAPYRIVLADDHMMFRHGIKRIIEEGSDFKVVGEVKDGLDLLTFLKSSTPDMVVLDISMPNLRGIEAAREIKKISPDTKILILTMHKEKEYIYHALSEGAEGYLLKEDADNELLNAIQTIREGRIYISPLLSEQMTELVTQSSRGDQITSETETLTTRERQVLKLIAEGNSSQEIADVLFISIRTVHHHRSNIMKKLKIKKSSELVKYAIRKGYTLLSI